MRAALPVWETTYAHDRRAHRHRCQCCRRIVEAGERVLMVKTADKGRTRVVHLDPCAEVIAVPADMCREGRDFTYRDLFDLRARETLKALGWSDKAIERAVASAAEAA